MHVQLSGKLIFIDVDQENMKKMFLSRPIRAA